MRAVVLACAVCALAAAEEKPAAEATGPVEMKVVLPAPEAPAKVCSVPLTNVLRAAPPLRMPMMQPRGTFNMPFVTVPAPPCDEKPVVKAAPLRGGGKPSGR